MAAATSRIRRLRSRRGHNDGVQRAASVRRSAALVSLMQLFCCRGTPFLPVSSAPAGSALTSGPPPSRAATRSRLLCCPGAAPAPRHLRDPPASCYSCRDPQRPGAALSRAPPPVRAPGPSLSAPNSVLRQAPPTGPSAGRAVPSSS
ncbi:hypothetical protein NDU88_001675 [Pleurodeles waltl]|uniref:Uncharacterized protein n=1 Tax=Pleurodeles waltl TaxID=8319 RepID=A0AAV7VCL5_PLEWA|nr:hypothetical protein NDU88_001675 [Pleurodeles waltl]